MPAWQTIRERSSSSAGARPPPVPLGVATRNGGGRAPALLVASREFVVATRNGVDAVVERLARPLRVVERREGASPRRFDAIGGVPTVSAMTDHQMAQTASVA